MLIRELPDNSRYSAARMEYTNGMGWTDKDYLILDIRSHLASIAAGLGGGKFTPWALHPLAEMQKREEIISRQKGFIGLAKLMARQNS